MHEPTLATIAARYGKTPAQIILRWDIELGIVAIPRSSNPERLAQNLDIFDFALTTDEIAAISALDTGAEQRVDSERLRLGAVISVLSFKMSLFQAVRRATVLSVAYFGVFIRRWGSHASAIGST